MDLAYLIQRREQELARADGAACDASRAAHRQLANLYHAVIDGRPILPGSRCGREE